MLLEDSLRQHHAGGSSHPRGMASGRRHAPFPELQSHYLFAEKFGRPGKGNDKGKVENLVGYARRNFMVPDSTSVDAGKNSTRAPGRVTTDRRERREFADCAGTRRPSVSRFQRDRVAMLTLPAAPYEPCEKVTARVNSLRRW